MACLVHPEFEAAARAAPPAVVERRVVPPAMTRCECAGVSFQEIARQMAATGGSLDDVQRRTGCGGTCTACVPDLRRFLSSL
jgi:NAD(P)H-nitrite reductase large subunit